MSIIIENIRKPVINVDTNFKLKLSSNFKKNLFEVL